MVWVPPLIKCRGDCPPTRYPCRPQLGDKGRKSRRSREGVRSPSLQASFDSAARKGATRRLRHLHPAPPAMASERWHRGRGRLSRAGPSAVRSIKGADPGADRPTAMTQRKFHPYPVRFNSRATCDPYTQAAWRANCGFAFPGITETRIGPGCPSTHDGRYAISVGPAADGPLRHDRKSKAAVRSALPATAERAPRPDKVRKNARGCCKGRQNL
jgi:hypothetical protein